MTASATQGVKLYRANPPTAQHQRDLLRCVGIQDGASDANTGNAMRFGQRRMNILAATLGRRNRFARPVTDATSGDAMPAVRCAPWAACSVVPHIVIMGCGRVGSRLATKLDDMGRSVTVIHCKIRRRFDDSDPPQRQERLPPSGSTEMPSCRRGSKMPQHSPQ